MAARGRNASGWKGGIVAYTVDGDVARLDLINEAITFYERKTNVRFVRRHDHKDYVRFRLDAKRPFTSDSVGRAGGEQQISISASSIGFYYHEIGHALGLIHEQQRSDRDNHIIIHFDKIPEDRHFDYEKQRSVNSPNYDYTSIMHYHAIQNGVVVMEAPGGVPDPADIGRGELPTAEDLDFINQFYPFPGVIRRSSSEQGAGRISEVSSVGWEVSTNNARIVTAIRNKSKRLQLIGWNVDHLGGIVRDNEDPDLDHGKATSIDLTRMGNHLVACMRNNEGNLLLISWTLQLELEAESEDLAEQPDIVRILPLSNDKFLIGCRDRNGRLKLITWRIDSQGNFEKVEDTGTNGPKISSLSLAFAAGDVRSQIIAAAVRSQSGRVQVFTYGCFVPSLTIAKIADSGTKFGKGSNVACASPSRGTLIVGCATESGHLKLIPVAISRDGLNITRLPGEASAESIKRLRMISTLYGVLTAVCDENNNLLLIKWRVLPTGIVRLGNSGDSAGRLVPSGPAPPNPLIDLLALPITNSTICTPVKNASGDLLLITWDDSNGPGELIR